MSLELQQQERLNDTDVKKTIGRKKTLAYHAGLSSFSEIKYSRLSAFFSLNNPMTLEVGCSTNQF